MALVVSVCVIHFTQRSKLLTTLDQSSIPKKTDIGRESPLLPTPLALGGPRRNIAITLRTEKLEWCGYQTVKKIRLHLPVSTEYTLHERYRHRRTPHDGIGGKNGKKDLNRCLPEQLMSFKVP